MGISLHRRSCTTEVEEEASLCLHIDRGREAKNTLLLYYRMECSTVQEKSYFWDPLLPPPIEKGAGKFNFPNRGHLRIDCFPHSAHAGGGGDNPYRSPI